MLDMYGLAAAHLSEFQRSRDEASARYNRRLATVKAERPGVIWRLASALFRRASRDRGRALAVQSAGGLEEADVSSCSGCSAPARIAA